MSYPAYPFPVDPQMYAEQRRRLGKSIGEAFPKGDHAALLRAGSEVPVNSTDVNYHFWQESFFNYLFGYQGPDAYGVVLADGTGILFIVRLPDVYAVWFGSLPVPESVKSTTGVEEVYYVEDMDKVLKEKGITTVEVLKDEDPNTYPPVLTADLPPGSPVALSTTWLLHTLSTQRCFKTEREAELLKYVCKVSSEAHVKVMQVCKPGMGQHQLEAAFLYDVHNRGGCRHASYACICATGSHGAYLHYIENDDIIVDGQMSLMDMGGNYMGYAADITCSYPVNGKFTEAQKFIYSAVLDAHDQVMRSVRPGVSWVDMHLLALRVMCGHLVKGGVLIGDVDTLMSKRIMGFFQPHGLGHLIGLDVHDVGAYLSDCPMQPEERDCCRLRTARVLQPGIYITIEPGCYFSHHLLESALADPEVKPYLNEKRIRELWDFGGVRIESDVLVTEDGVLNFTRVPRTIEEIERTMAGEPFSKDVEVYHNM